MSRFPYRRHLDTPTYGIWSQTGRTPHCPAALQAEVGTAHYYQPAQAPPAPMSICQACSAASRSPPTGVTPITPGWTKGIHVHCPSIAFPANTCAQLLHSQTYNMQHQEMILLSVHTKIASPHKRGHEAKHPPLWLCNDASIHYQGYATTGALKTSGRTWLVHAPADVHCLKSGEVYRAAVPKQASIVPITVCQSPSCKHN